MQFLNTIRRLVGIQYQIQKKNPLSKILVPGIGRMALWGYRSDSIPVWNYIRNLQHLKQEIIYCNKRYPGVRRDLKILRHNLQAEFEGNLDRIWNDKKSGTYFHKGEPFEPHQVNINHNLVMWDGIGRFTELISGESTDYFDFMAMGTGVTSPTFGDTKLEIEVARVWMREAGDLNSDGIVLKSTAAFPPGVPTSDIMEFGALDLVSNGQLEFRVVIDGDPLHHIQGDTFVQNSHSIVFQSVMTNTA